MIFKTARLGFVKLLDRLSQSAWQGGAIAICILANICWEGVSNAASIQDDSQQKQQAEAVGPSKSVDIPIESVESAVRKHTKIFQPHITSNVFEELCAELGLNELQKADAEADYEIYFTQVQEVHKKLLDSLVTLALKYFAARTDVGEELARWNANEEMLNLSKTARRYQLQLKKLLGEFLIQLQSRLTESQSEKYPGFVRAWRRSVMLNPHAPLSSHNLVYHVDLLKLISDISKQQPLLASLLDSNAEKLSNPMLAEARRKCIELLVNFEIEFDVLIQKSFWRSWDRYFESLHSWAFEDEEAKKKRDRKSGIDWIKVYRSNTSAAENLGLIIQDAMGKPLADIWREHYYAAYFPVLYTPKSTDLIYEWLVFESDISLKQLEAIESIYSQYLNSRRTLRSSTQSMLIRVTKELDLSSPAEISSYHALGLVPKIQNLFEKRRALSAHINKNFRSILVDNQRTSFDSALMKIKHPHNKELFEF